MAASSTGAMLTVTRVRGGPPPTGWRVPPGMVIAPTWVPSLALSRVSVADWVTLT